MKKICEDCKKVVEIDKKRYATHKYLFWGDDITSKFTCYECYAKKWDGGFEASMEYSDEMLECK